MRGSGSRGGPTRDGRVGRGGGWHRRQSAPWARHESGSERGQRQTRTRTSAVQRLPAHPPKVTVLAPAPAQPPLLNLLWRAWQGHSWTFQGRVFVTHQAPLCLGNNANVDSFFSFNSDQENRLQAAHRRGTRGSHGLLPRGLGVMLRIPGMSRGGRQGSRR